MRWWPYAVAGGSTLPWLIAVGAGLHPAHAITAALAGIAILGAAFLLSWGCEVAEMDVPQAIAVSLLALVAVLPEYAVDATFAWKAAAHPENAGYAIANMTGGNRLLLGVGWPLVVIIAWWRGGNRGSYKFHVQLPADMGVEVAVLLLATLYAAVPVYRGSLTLVDTAVYVVMYVAYLIAGSRTEGHEPEIVGPAAVLAELGTGLRRASVVGMFVFAAGAIFLAAEPFAEALVATGREARDRRVPARPVGGPVRERSARGGGRGPAHASRRAGDGHAHAGVEQGEPVDLARRHPRGGVLGRERRPGRAPAR